MSVERIKLQLTAEPRLSPVVRAAVLWKARASGISARLATSLANEVASRFRELAKGTGSARRRSVRLSLEAGPEGLLARLSPGGGGRVLVFRMRRIMTGRDGAPRSRGARGVRRDDPR